MTHRYAGLLTATLLCLAAPAYAQSTGTFPTSEPTAAPAPAAPAPAAPAPVAPAPAAPPPAAPAPAPAAAPAPAPAAAPAAAPAPAAPVSTIPEPPPPPPRSSDNRPVRARRPLFIGGELGWNGLAGFGANFSYHPIPYLAFDTGLGFAFTGLRIGVRARVNFLTGEWTPFAGVGATFSQGSGGEEVETQPRGETIKLKVLPSTYVQLAGGVNYTGSEGFVFMATTGYAIRLANNTRFVSGDREVYEEDVRPLFRGGVIISVAFGYAF